MERCSPHPWRTPAVGDAALVWDMCEHRLDLVHEMTPEMQADVVRDYRRCCGPLVGRQFQEALEAAVTAARQRAGAARAGTSDDAPPSPGAGGA